MNTTHAQTTELQGPVRFVTATSLFDGHDAAINVMRRIMQQHGAEVIHLGHNRSVDEIVTAAIQEDAHGIAVSSYQGGHIEYFKYMIDLLKERHSDHIRVYGGGGGVIVREEIEELHNYGVARNYTPEDGQKLGLAGMIGHMVNDAKHMVVVRYDEELERLTANGNQPLARCLTFVEFMSAGLVNDETAQFFNTRLAALAADRKAPVLGITGTGGAGKSSLTDELVRRFLLQQPELRIAILSVDPTHRRTGGALLGDRIRMNAINSERVFMRSLATRQENLALAQGVDRAVSLCKAAGYQLVIVETAGIGQSDTEIVDLADFTLYVMTPEFGAASQLEKIGMLDYADMVAVNKFDKPGAKDALRDVRKQVRRSRGQFDAKVEDIAVYGTVASRFKDPYTDSFFGHLTQAMVQKMGLDWPVAPTNGVTEVERVEIIPPQQVRYLSEIAQLVRAYKTTAEQKAAAASRAHGLRTALETVGQPMPAGLETVQAPANDTAAALLPAYNEAVEALSPEERQLVNGFDALKASYSAEQFTFQVRDKVSSIDNYTETLTHLKVPKIALPRFRDWGDRLHWMLLENVPGSFPFTGGVFPFKRPEEEPTRMFAGEGPAERTNRRFHFVSSGQPAKRLSTAFDSVTLYGEDPDRRPDIYGKIGTSGVSICNLDDMKRLYSGFDLTAPATSVSMTINGPAPTILAFFLNTAIDQNVERHLKAEGKWEQAESAMSEYFARRGAAQPTYRSALPPTNEGFGLGILGLSGDKLVPAETYQKIKEDTLRVVRGTVQADILKEDQAQNTCIFSADFSLTMMGDMQQYFVDHDVANFYSVSVSGYHMAEAGANPISQVAFTLANGFTFVEYYLSRGMPIDKFARNLSFFFSNGMEPEYQVIGRVARRIWAIALKNRYKASERAQKLKYHIQTSGRSLHAQEISFNDLRTTLQALYAVYDNCNSLHTNAYDEAITTPTEESVRRAMAIQLIINRELGMTLNDNPLQGAFIVEELTELVEEAILAEFDRLTERGGVLGAMETMYQRGKIQDESLYYEELKHSGAYPIIGVNTFLPEEGKGHDAPVELMRSTNEEKEMQIEGLAHFRKINESDSAQALDALSKAILGKGNGFEALMEAVKSSSLGQITSTLYEVGGQYRRSM